MTFTALFLFLGTLGLSFWASHRVKSIYRQRAAQSALSGLTGAQTAHRAYARLRAGRRD
jgi:Zn-dependent membrane protease YugP